MTNLIDFLRERLAEDEAVAQAACPNLDKESGSQWQWTTRDPVERPRQGPDDVRSDTSLTTTEVYNIDANGEEQVLELLRASVVYIDVGRHIALHDPARVLREVTAKRRIMERHRLANELEMQSHFPATEEERRFFPGYQPCVGCGDDGGDGGWRPEFNVDDINNCPELRDLAAIYSDHRDYQEQWRP